jgi:hypothetical protein
MSMRDHYRTRAAEFQARALCETDQMARLYFESLAKDYLYLAEQAERNDRTDLNYGRYRRGSTIQK